MIIYYSITFLTITSYLFSVSFSSKSKKKSIGNTSLKTLIFLSFVLVFSLTSALIINSGILVDSERYIRSFYIRYPSYNLDISLIFSSDQEFGYVLLNKIVYDLTNSSFILFLIISLIVSSINFFIIIKSSENIFLSLFFYLITFYFLFSLYLMKQVLAVSFVNLALYNFLKKKNRKLFTTTILILIATTFHITALFSLLIFPIVLFGKYKLLSYIAFFILFFLFVFIYFDVLKVTSLPLISNFLDDNILLEDQGQSFAIILKGTPYFIILIFTMFFKKKYAVKSLENNFFTIAVLIITLTYFFSATNYWIFRLGWYFYLVFIILYPTFIKNIRKSNGLDFSILITFLFSAFSIYILIRQIWIST